MRFFISTRVFLGACLALISGGGGAAMAAPQPWEMGMQSPVTPIAHMITNFHDMLLVIITAIVALVVILLLTVIVRFNARANPVPNKFTHNTVLEVLWTAIPIIILVIIAIPSFKLVYAEHQVVDADMTIKATGHQWYWSYEYPDDGIAFDAFLVDDADLPAGAPRLLATDNHVVVPVDTKVRVLVTASPEDVIHSWAMPAFGIKMDAVPGRLNETWFRAEKEGVYYGQCSELCGVNHGFMPITVEVVSKDRYQVWLKRARKEFAADDEGPGKNDEGPGGAVLAASMASGR